MTTEQHLYRKATGTEIKFFNWRLERGDEIRLITDIDQERDVTRFNQELATRSWSVKDPAASTDMLVTRRDNELLMRGTFKGKKLNKTVAIDAAPWYQALSVSLQQFTNPNIGAKEFWSVRPDTLDVHKVKVTPEGKEDLEQEGQLTPVIKLKIQLPGLKSMFWSCHYWLRQEDGLFIRYHGPSGPPGWPDTIVELLDNETQSNRVAGSDRYHRYQ